MSAVASRLQHVADEAARRGCTRIKVVDWSPEWHAQALPIMREMHANSIYSELPLDEDKVIRQLSASGGPLVPHRYFRIAVKDGEGLGAFYGTLQRSFFCDQYMAYDMGWWVKKDARGSLAAPLLLLDFEKWARNAGARKVMIGQSTAQDIETTTRLFKACGYRVIGYNTVKDL